MPRDEHFMATDEQIESIKARLCPVDCPHKDESQLVDMKHVKKTAPIPNFHGYINGYWCNKYRSVLGAHLLRPFAIIMGGDPLCVVMKSPFCPDNAKQESDHD